MPNITEEILRLKYETAGKQEVASAQAGLAKLEARVESLKKAYKSASLSQSAYVASLEQTAQAAARYQATIDRWQGAMGGMGGGSGGRRGALGRSAFNVANISQDIAQAGPYAAINNLLQPYLWKDFAAAVGGGKAALAGFGTAAVAVGAAFMTIDQGLKKAKLSWSDFGAVLGNLQPIEAAGEAIQGLGVMITDTLGGQEGVNAIDKWLGDLAEYTLGWRTATEAVRQHKDALAQAKVAEEQFRQNQAKFVGADQQAQREAGQRFGTELAGMGGQGGLEEIKKRIGGTKGQIGAAILINEAIGGNRKSQDKLMALLKSMGMDTMGLEAARDLGPRAAPEEGGMMAGLASDYREGRFDTRREAARKNIEDSYDREFETRIGEMYGINQRMRVRFREGALGGDADGAQKEMTDRLTEVLSSTLPEDEARDRAQKFVEAGREEFERGLAERRADPENLRNAQMGLMRNNLAALGFMDSMIQGPRTMSAESFATQVQDSQSPFKEQIKLMERQLTAQQLTADRLRILEDIALLGQ